MRNALLPWFCVVCVAFLTHTSAPPSVGSVLPNLSASIFLRIYNITDATQFNSTDTFLFRVLSVHRPTK